MPGPVAYLGAEIFDGVTLHSDAALLVSETRILDILPATALSPHVAREALNGGILAPGFVDLQLNGGGGVMFNDDPSAEALRVMARAHARLGATTIMPTLITDTPAHSRAAIAAVTQAVAEGVPGIAGLHLEGPHLSVVRKGAHDPALIRPMQSDDEAMLIAAAEALPALIVTIAPESVTPDQMRRLARAGVILSLGHTDAEADAVTRAADAGVGMVTHLFNAMSQLGNRAPGVVGATLGDGRLSAGLIADLIHVHPTTIRAAMAAKTGPGEVFLVSDAMATAGSEIDGFVLNGRRIRRDGNQLSLADGTLAGAHLDLATAVRNMVRSIGTDPARALAMATRIPAGLIGAGDRAGRLAPGRTADFLHLDDTLSLAAVWQGGSRL